MIKQKILKTKCVKLQKKERDGLAYVMLAFTAWAMYANFAHGEIYEMLPKL